MPGSRHGCYLPIHIKASVVPRWKDSIDPINAHGSSHTDENVVTSCCSSLGRGAAACGASGAAAETCHTAGR